MFAWDEEEEIEEIIQKHSKNLRLSFFPNFNQADLVSSQYSRFISIMMLN